MWRKKQGPLFFFVQNNQASPLSHPLTHTIHSQVFALHPAPRPPRRVGGGVGAQEDLFVASRCERVNLCPKLGRGAAVHDQRQGDAQTGARRQDQEGGGGRGGVEGALEERVGRSF